MTCINDAKFSSWPRPSNRSSGRVGVLCRDWQPGSYQDSAARGPSLSSEPSWAWSSGGVAVLGFGARETLIASRKASAVAGAAVASSSRRTRPFHSETLGKYRLLERIGRGRQAEVWRAIGVEGVSGEVALKVLPATPSGRDPCQRAQLRREGERGARLTGPSLLPIFEHGEADGTAFLAMPLVIGCTLAALIAQRFDDRAGRDVPETHRLASVSESFYIREVVLIMARVARAAHDAHLGLVVHRDIKPGNILVRGDHSAGVYLCDFGLARDLDVATPRQLRDGAGSPQYMAPERLLMRPADEVRCDVFALGVTLCESLTLAPPVEVPSGMSRDRWAGFLAVAQPRRPSVVMPTIPLALEATILRAIARNPEHRHPSAAAFAEDLERFVAEPPPKPTGR